MTAPLQDLLQHFDPSIYFSLALLFGIAAQFRTMDGYSFLTRIVHGLQTRFGIVYAVVIVTAVFSPLILNDVVVLILTPVLLRYAKDHKVDMALLIVSEITFTNIAGSLTPLGNPQNILLWQESGVSASDFVLGTCVPLFLSGAIAIVVLYPLSRGVRRPDSSIPSKGSLAPAVYLAIVAAVVFSANLLGISNVLSLAVSFLLGFPFTFRAIYRISDEFDVRSLLILYGLVALVTVVAVVIQPLAGPYAAQAVSGAQPFSAAFVALLSSIISNVPTTQLLLSLTTVSPGAAPKLAVEAGLAGNIDPVASFANILALLMARRAGFPIRRAVLLQFVVGTVAFLPAFL